MFRSQVRVSKSEAILLRYMGMQNLELPTKIVTYRSTGTRHKVFDVLNIHQCRSILCKLWQWVQVNITLWNERTISKCRPKTPFQRRKKKVQSISHTNNIHQMHTQTHKCQIKHVQFIVSFWVFGDRIEPGLIKHWL